MVTVKSTINISSQTVPQIIPVVQGDTGRAILFTLADFTIPAGASATYYVQKPSGEAVYNNATIDGNTVLVELTAQSIIEKGDNYGQVRITVGEDVVTSFDFILLVKEFRGIDAVQSLTEMNIFDKAVEQAAEEIDEVKTGALDDIGDAKDAALQEIEQSTGNFADAFSASTTYVAGDYVIHSGQLYRFTANHAAGAWTGSDAEAVTVGEELTDLKADTNTLKEDLQESGAANIFHDGTYSNSDWRGVTLAWDNGIATLSGTATGGYFTSPNIYYKANAFPDGIHAGDIITFNIESTNTNVYLDVFSYVNELVNEVLFSRSGQYVIPDNATGMLMRLFVYNGADATGTFSFTIHSIPSRKTTSEVLPVIIPTNGSAADAIMASLKKYGRVILGKGTYYINTPITMPDNSIIQGAGDSTVIKTMSSINAIVVGANCSVENVRISSDEGYTISKGTHAGIWVEGNHESAPLKYNTKISNVSIDGFSLAGIYGKATGYWVADSISAINCKVYNCYAGIYLEDYSEFGRYTNIVCYSCYSGLVNKSGNNMFVNCSFSNNTVGVYLDCEDVDTSNNNGHGAVIGCTINHSNNNNGYGIIARGVATNGFMFDSCHLWYSKVLVEKCTGIVIQNSTFGGGTPTVESYTNTAFFLRNNLFKTSPTLTGTMIKDGNYLFDGTVIE